VKYVVLIYSNPQSWAHPTFAQAEGYLAASESERAEIDGQFRKLMTEIHESGELVDSAALTDPAATTVVVVRDGRRTITDGPFAEASEYMAGYFVLECATDERVIEIAARFPDAQFGRVEVRAIASLPPGPGPDRGERHDV
jgi:hypothetical protein